jgi:hypothetical protein
MAYVVYSLRQQGSLRFLLPIFRPQGEKSATIKW